MATDSPSAVLLPESTTAGSQNGDPDFFFMLSHLFEEPWWFICLIVVGVVALLTCLGFGGYKLFRRVQERRYGHGGRGVRRIKNGHDIEAHAFASEHDKQRSQFGHLHQPTQSLTITAFETIDTKEMFMMDAPGAQGGQSQTDNNELFKTVTAKRARQRRKRNERKRQSQFKASSASPRPPLAQVEDEVQVIGGMEEFPNDIDMDPNGTNGTNGMNGTRAKNHMAHMNDDGSDVDGQGSQIIDDDDSEQSASSSMSRNLESNPGGDESL